MTFTITNVRSILRFCTFNPKTDRVLGIVCDLKNPMYLKGRVVELINQTKLTQTMPFSTIKLCIQLLIILWIHQENESGKTHPDKD